jgi:protein-L-isoaspartate(D-aspartate) O-methyltransferase
VASITYRTGEREFKRENLFETVVERLPGFEARSTFSF